MSWDDYELQLETVRPRFGDDPAVQELEPLLLALFDADLREVYYESQLVVRFGNRFFGVWCKQPM